MTINVNPNVAQKGVRSKYQKLTGVIAFNRIFADVAGCACGGLFLSQVDYWSQRALEYNELSGGWFVKSAREWEEKTALNRREQDKVRKHLVKLGVIDTYTGGCPRTTSYKLNYEVLDECIEAILNGTYKGTRPKNENSGKPRSAKDLAYIQFVRSEQTKLVHSVQTESDKGFSIFSNNELESQFVHSEQTQFVHSEQTQFVHSEQTNYIYKNIKENIVLHSLKTRERDAEGEGGFVDCNFLQKQQDEWNEQQVNATTTEYEVVQDYSSQQGLIENLSLINQITHESKCSAAPPPRVEVEMSMNNSEVALSIVKGVEKQVNEERYTRTVEPGVKRNIDGSVCLPWDIQGQRFKYEAEFEAWMCQKMSNTTFYKKLTAGAALTQVRKHISNASYDNKRRDELMIEWEAMQASKRATEVTEAVEAPSSGLVINRSLEMSPEVATMTVEEIKQKQQIDEIVKRSDLRELQDKAEREFMRLKGIDKLTGRQIMAQYPNWHQDMLLWSKEQYPELA